MRNICVILLSLLHGLYLSGQEYKVPMSSGLVSIIGVDEIVVEGYDGKEIIVTAPNREKQKDKKAEGLRVLSGNGLIDNSGLGLSIKEENGQLTIQQVSRKWDHEEYLLRLPRSMDVLLEHSSATGSDIIIGNMIGEIEVSVNYNNVYLEGIYGPSAIKTVYGEIEAEFDKLAQNGSHSFYSVYGNVDVSLPKGAQANVELQTDYGSLYTNLDLDLNTGNIDHDTKDSDDHHHHHHNNCNNSTSEFIDGKLNGGGVDLILKSNYENIYLREN